MKNFRNFLAWVFLLTSLVLVLWLIFGDSPTELAVFSVVAGFVLIKMFDTEKRLTCLEMGMKNGFCNVKKDMKLTQKKLDLVCDKLEVVA